MPSCPHCSERIALRHILSSDLRHLECVHCPAILSVKTHAGLLPGIVLIMLGPPVAKAVQEGWFSVTIAVTGGLALLLALAWIGFARSRITLLRLRHTAA